MGSPGFPKVFACALVLPRNGNTVLTLESPAKEPDSSLQAHSLPGKDPAWFNVEADQYDWFGRPRQVHIFADL